MSKSFKESRRDLRERAFQALYSMEHTGQALDAAQFAYTYDKDIDEDEVLSTPLFVLNLVKGVIDHKEELDSKIAEHLKSGWSVERLTLPDRTILRLGLYETLYFEETPDRVAVNEAIELAKKYSDETAAKFINGILSRYIIDEIE